MTDKGICLDKKVPCAKNWRQIAKGDSMKRALKLCLAFVVVYFVGIAAVNAADLTARQPTKAEVGKKVICPVKNVNFEVAKDTPVVDYKGKTYFFCCDTCLNEFKKDPDKYAAAGALAVREPTKAEVGKMVNCTVMNIKFEVAKNTPIIEYNGKTYFFCCEHCVDQFRANPDKYAAK